MYVAKFDQRRASWVCQSDCGFSSRISLCSRGQMPVPKASSSWRSETSFSYAPKEVAKLRPGVPSLGSAVWNQLSPVVVLTVSRLEVWPKIRCAASE